MKPIDEYKSITEFEKAVRADQAKITIDIMDTGHSNVIKAIKRDFFIILAMSNILTATIAWGVTRLCLN